MRFAQTRDLVAEAAQAGIALTVVDGELRFAAKPGALSSELRLRLELSREDLIGELSKPRFTIATRQADTVKLQTGMLGWWSETRTNQLLANATHVVWRLHGDSCERRFRAALETCVARHDLLTARVVSIDGDIHLKFADVPLVVAARGHFLRRRERVPDGTPGSKAGDRTFGLATVRKRGGVPTVPDANFIDGNNLWLRAQSFCRRFPGMPDPGAGALRRPPCYN
jgi:hypothetical protein